MIKDPFDYFSVTPRDILTKLDDFTVLELDLNHQGEALNQMLLAEGLALPQWCRFLLHRGVIETRRRLLNTYSSLSGKEAVLKQ